jgi:Xaa-Pro dipeptidase
MANLERAKRIMDRGGLDGLIATSLPNLFYLSGLWDPGMMLFPRSAEDYAIASRDTLASPILVVGQGDLDLTTGLRKVAETYAYGDFVRYVAEDVKLTQGEQLLKTRALDRPAAAGGPEALAEALKAAGLAAARVGLDEASCNGDMEALKALLPGLTIVPASGVFGEIRMIKTPEEVECLRAAVSVTEQAVMEGVSQARAGISELEMARLIKVAMTARNAAPSFLLLKFGRHSGYEQAPRADVCLEQGDQIWIDGGCILGGYHSDIARTFAFGEPSPRVRSVYRALLAGEDAALAAVRPGVRASAVFQATMDAVRANGIPDYRRHHVGHGIGLEIYDRPRIGHDDHTPLEPGMVLNIEPPYYEIGIGAAHVEDTFLVTEAGARLLTTISRELEIVGA